MKSYRYEEERWIVEKGRFSTRTAGIRRRSVFNSFYGVRASDRERLEDGRLRRLAI
jgi:hypothetical protein